MANVKLVFGGSEQSSSDETTIVTYANDSNEIFIEVDDKNTVATWICLDKSTAIRLQRELKKQISFLNE